MANIFVKYCDIKFSSLVILIVHSVLSTSYSSGPNINLSPKMLYKLSTVLSIK